MADCFCTGLAELFSRCFSEQGVPAEVFSGDSAEDGFHFVFADGLVVCPDVSAPDISAEDSVRLPADCCFFFVAVRYAVCLAYAPEGAVGCCFRPVGFGWYSADGYIRYHYYRAVPADIPVSTAFADTVGSVPDHLTDSRMNPAEDNIRHCNTHSGIRYIRFAVDAAAAALAVCFSDPVAEY